MNLKTMLTLAAVIAPLAYLNHVKPLLPAHQEKIYTTALGADAPVDTMTELPQWADLELSDWIIATATRDGKKASMVSVGIAGYIKVVDTDWAITAFDLKPVAAGEEKKAN